MVTAYDVDANRLIAKVAQKLKELKIEKPEWTGRVKTGAHAQRLPQDEDFWYMRCASLLRNVYMHSPVGVSKLRTHYGGREKRGVKRERRRDAGGNLIRKGFQALEKLELVKAKKGVRPGRYITPKGQKLLDAVAKEVKGGGKAQ